MSQPYAPSKRHVISGLDHGRGGTGAVHHITLCASRACDIAPVFHLKRRTNHLHARALFLDPADEMTGGEPRAGDRRDPQIAARRFTVSVEAGKRHVSVWGNQQMQKPLSRIANMRRPLQLGRPFCVPKPKSWGAASCSQLRPPGRLGAPSDRYRFTIPASLAEATAKVQ